MDVVNNHTLEVFLKKNGIVPEKVVSCPKTLLVFLKGSDLTKLKSLAEENREVRDFFYSYRVLSEKSVVFLGEYWIV